MGHLNGFLAPRGGNLNKPIFKSSNARGGGMLNFRIDRRIINATYAVAKRKPEKKIRLAV